MEELFTLSEVSKKLKIPIETLRKYVRDGKLKAVKIGRSWRLSESQIKEFLDNASKSE